MRAVVSIALSASLIVAMPFQGFAATSLGTVEGQVKVDGRALLGVDLSVVDVASGAVHRVRTNDAGNFRVNVGPGQYVLASNAASGLAVAKGPALLVVAPGQVVTAQLELTAVAGAVMQDAPPAAPTAAGAVRHDPVQCVLVGEHPMLEATIEPAGAVQRARLYFKSPTSDFFYTEMLPTGTGFRGFMPRPTLAANPITYYIAATTTDFAEIRTPEITVRVVEKESDCEGRLAPVGTPPPGTQFFTAAGAAGSPSGFAAGIAGAVGGGAGISTTALLIGAGLAGVTIAAVVLSDDDDPSPSPSPLPLPSPSPSPLPSPSPSPSAVPPPPAPPVSPFQ